MLLISQGLPVYKFLFRQQTTAKLKTLHTSNRGWKNFFKNFAKSFGIFGKGCYNIGMEMRVGPLTGLS